MKPKRRSKTIWFNVAALCLLVLLEVATHMSFVAPNADLVLLIGGVAACVNIVLRTITVEPVSRRGRK